MTHSLFSPLYWECPLVHWLVLKERSNSTFKKGVHVVRDARATIWFVHLTFFQSWSSCSSFPNSSSIFLSSTITSTMVLNLLRPRPSSVTPLLRSFSTSSPTSSNLAYLESIDTNPNLPPGITLLTINRPAAKNAISRELLDQLQGSVEAARWDKWVSKRVRGRSFESRAVPARGAEKMGLEGVGRMIYVWGGSALYLLIFRLLNRERDGGGVSFTSTGPLPSHSSCSKYHML